MIRSSRALILLVIAAVAACATLDPPNDRFLVDEVRFYNQVRTIALTPLATPPDLETREEAQEIFTAALTSSLERRGYTVLPPETAMEIADRLTHELGGIFDPVTGERSEEKHEAVRRHLLSELETEHGADAILHPRLDVVKADFHSAWAQWCGTRRDIIDFWDAMALGGAASGYVGALCLRLVIEDTSGTDLYFGEGGVEVLAEFEGKELAHISHGRFFQDPERNTQAVELALQKLEPVEWGSAGGK
jgi:hypothetical protein